MSSSKGAQSSSAPLAGKSAAVAQIEKQRLSQIQQRIMQVCRKFPKGVSDDDMNSELKDIPLDERVLVINRLLGVNRLKVMTDQSGLIFYKEIAPELAQKFADLTPEDIQVFEIIEQAGNTGVWVKDLKFRLKLQTKTINKSLKMLKLKKLIKSVKTIQGKNKIVYMLHDLEPSREITGGPWYKDTDLNLELITSLQEAAYKVIQQKRLASTADVLEHVSKQGISNTDLNEEDMQLVMNTLVYDGLIEESVEQSHLYGHTVYKQSVSFIQDNPFSEIPCSTCPVFQQCYDNGDVNPQSCVYLKKWMELDF